MLSAMQCDLCGTKMTSGLRNWHWTCRTCGLERSSLKPHINDANLMDESERASALHDLREQNFATLLTWLYRQYPPDFPRMPRLLEVGCAHGWFMEQAQLGHHVLGIEPDIAIAAMAAAKGLNVRQGFFPEALDEDDVFDTIVFNDVLEHIPDVRAVMSLCHARLTSGGYLVINAPNNSGIFYRAAKWLTRLGRSQSFDRMWQLGLPSPHLYYFNTRAVDQLAQITGFVMQSSCHLPAIQTQGLVERIHYTGGTSKFKARAMATCIAALMPIVSASSPDIRVWLLKKKEAAQ